LPRGHHLKLIGRGRVELALGQPVVVRSTAGCTLRNLVLLAPAAVRSLIQVHCTYAQALATGTQSGEQKRVTFARCSVGRPALLLENCKLHGGHHGIDARGNFGLCPQRQAGGWDVAGWFSCCKSLSHEAVQATSIPSGDLQDLHWVQQFGSRMILRDCEISHTEMEALHFSHGVHVDMEKSWVHHCGTGVSVVHCMLQSLSRIPFMQRTPTDIRLVDNSFEDIGDQAAWSSAISLGSTVSSPSRASGSDGAFITDYRTTLEWQARGPLWPVEAEVRDNKVYRCNIGVIAHAVKLICKRNTLYDLRLAGWQLLDSLLDLAENTLKGCGGVGLAVSSGAGTSLPSHLSGNRILCSEGGVRVTAQSAPCTLRILDHTLEGNGDGFTILGQGANVEVRGCTVRSNRRHGIFVGRAAHALLLENSVTGNGRGVAIADGSANVKRCRFEGNLGWAVRLSEPPFNASGLPEPSKAASVVSENVFADRGPGNVGRKRILVEPWHGESGATVENNTEMDGGESVQPLRKRRREVDICAEGLANMSI